VVSIDYVIRLMDGREVESSADGSPLTYLHGRSQIVPGVERAIEGAESGEVVEVMVPPGEAFGDRDPKGVFLVPRGSFPPEEEVEQGMTFVATRPDGKTVIFRVVEAYGGTVLVDTNHPLAGEALYVRVAVRGVREATADEKRAGRVTHEPPQVSPPS
jgi:FKBP-type peptidyl-prolyl cis-trans isomerase SlyD